MSNLAKVMLVEDDLDIALLIEIALKDIGGLEFAHFVSGIEALAQVQGVGPDLILLDYRMPEISGGEVLAALRTVPSARHIPVIFITASLMPTHVEKLLGLGALAVLPKPFDPLTLAAQIQEIWAGR